MKNIFVVFALSIIFITGSLYGRPPRPVLVRNASDFTLRTLDGKRFTLSENLGKGPMIINFWATWCAHCLAEMRELEKIEEKFRESGLRVVSVSVDEPRAAATVESTVRARKIPFTVLLDANKDLSRSWHVSRVPHLFILDCEGSIVYEHTGYKRGDEKKLERILEHLINTQDTDDPDY